MRGGQKGVGGCLDVENGGGQKGSRWLPGCGE